ncbi:PAC2 family protein [Candidatus Micrarchaeota archaeon]|nr:PAC2 family protein [Candidatus Micrarchaeota archaeon]
MNPRFLESMIRVKKSVKPKNPILIMGLPGVGFVSKLAADHLIKTSQAEHFATLYSPNFPNQVIAMKNGALRPFSMRFYYKKFKKRDVVILKGDVQPLTVEGQYEVTGKILEFFQRLGGSEVVAMAGYALNRTKEKPDVFCSATSKSYLEYFYKLGAKPNQAVIPIVGMAGLVPAISRLYHMRGTCLLVETPGQAIDATGASVLLDLISKMLGDRIDTKTLRGKAEKAEHFLKKIELQARKEEQAGFAIPETPKKDVLSYIH